MEELLELLKRTEPDVNFEGNEHLVDNEDLDSLSVVEIVTAINKEYDIEIPINEVVPENFNSVEAIWNLVQRLLDE